MLHSKSRKTSSCDAVVFRERPLDIVCLTVWNGMDAMLKKQEANSGLNPAHVPDWWVNNPTLAEFCFTMIGRADIEGSKSNVAMNAWLPQASYPCVGFPLSVPVLSWLFDARGRSSKEPFPVRPAFGTRRPALTAGAARAVHRQPTGLGLGGCSPWRPDAVMSTTGRGRHSVLWIFKGRWERTGHHATCGALPAAGPYLRLSRFQGGQAVKQKR
ncbi:hypothetical protein CQW23_30678 [Capsicum baccatum]|uniref:Uncharacterized protein n=1 Tax=Capsicum baccatum TaxID=33114 RepID=A0A2G2V9N3_CAPBA|nr:hypothetical protein CQW23_30678 [Capsicum baccatum]